jgi:dTDP-4-amino-4,6-dideoxygalactose transaminase
VNNNAPVIPLVDLKAQYERLKPSIDAAIAEVIGQTAFIGNLTNAHVQKFEQDYAAWVGVRHAIGCANGTDSLEILLKAAGLGPGDEVIVPAMSWIATSEAVSNIGATPVFADIDARTYTLCPEAARAAVTARTKAIIPVHLYGHPADMDAIMELAAEFNLFVLEDCAQAHGARYKGRVVGTIGNAGSFSFFPGKNLGAYGDAGGMTTNDDRIAEVARMISQHGQSAGKHDHRIEGRNSRLDGIQAAVLGVKLPYLSEWTKRRQEHAALYSRLLSDLELPLQSCEGHVNHVYHLYVIQVEGRAEFMGAMKEQGISTAIQYPKALPLLSAYAHKGHTPEQFPNAHRLAQRCVSLPMYPELTTHLIERVVSSVRTALASKR